MEQNWFSINVTCSGLAVDAAELALSEFGAQGTTIDLFRKTVDSDQTVSGYFDSEPDVPEFRLFLEEVFSNCGLEAEQILAVELSTIEHTDWLAEWKKHWRPTVLGGFVIAPPWEKVDDATRIVVYIEPNMAFGTGTHNTTQLCIGEIEREYTSGDSFMDVGTGTGILAIAVAKLNDKNGKTGAIFGCDTDVDSVRLADENAVLNGVGDLIEFSDGSIDDSTRKYDVVCANLTVDVIEPMLGLLIEKTKKILILSGILTEQETIIRSALSRLGYDEPRIENSGEWISVTVSIS